MPSKSSRPVRSKHDFSAWGRTRFDRFAEQDGFLRVAGSHEMLCEGLLRGINADTGRRAGEFAGFDLGDLDQGMDRSFLVAKRERGREVDRQHQAMPELALHAIDQKAANIAVWAAQADGARGRGMLTPPSGSLSDDLGSHCPAHECGEI